MGKLSLTNVVPSPAVFSGGEACKPADQHPGPAATSRFKTLHDCEAADPAAGGMELALASKVRDTVLPPLWKSAAAASTKGPEQSRAVGDLPRPPAS